jgi:hypothetical protein
VLTRRGDDYTTEESLANLRLSLFDAVAWCRTRASLADPRNGLRSPTLAPYAFNESRHETVYDVVARRHRALARTEESSLAGGRLLGWERDTTIDDGVGEAETHGFLDESDMPPWDTWIAYSDGHRAAGLLVSWVPEVFVPSVDAAVRYNAYDALYWLSDSDSIIARALARDGLLV